MINKEFIKNLGKNVDIVDEKFIETIRTALKIMHDVERTYVNLVAVNNDFNGIQIKNYTDEHIVFRLFHKGCEGGYFTQAIIPFNYFNSDKDSIISLHGHFCDMYLINMYKEQENRLKEYKKNLFNKR